MELAVLPEEKAAARLKRRAAKLKKGKKTE